MPILSLYEIDQHLEQLTAAIIDAGGEITDEIEQEYADLLEIHDDKAESYIAVLNDLQLTAEAVKQEEQRLRDRRRALERSAQRLKDRLCASMRARGTDEIKTTLGTIRVQQASRRSIIVDADPDDLPEEFQRVSVKADKRAIRDWLERNGTDAVDLSGQPLAHLDEPTYYVRIY